MKTATKANPKRKLTQAELDVKAVYGGIRKSTKVFTILNEEKMELVKHPLIKKRYPYNEIHDVCQAEYHGQHSTKVMMFETEWQADKWAASNLEMWSIVESNFNHQFIQHKQNMKPEIVRIESMGMNDTDNLALNVKIRFGTLFIEFGWTKNIKSGMVFNCDTPEKYNEMEVDMDDAKCWVWKEWMEVSEAFKFDEVSCDLRDEIERGEHHIE